MALLASDFAGAFEAVDAGAFPAVEVGYKQYQSAMNAQAHKVAVHTFGAIAVQVDLDLREKNS